MYTVLEVIKYIIPAIIVLAACFLMIREFLLDQKGQRLLKVRADAQQYALPIRMQAYERLVLFLERISPTNMVHRIRKPEMTSAQLQMALIETIRQEFEHNVSQQIYVSSQAWNMIVLVKDELVKVITAVGKTVPADSSSRDYSKALFEFFLKSDGLPTQKAIDILKAEARMLF